jgi:hypothetical protein
MSSVILPNLRGVGQSQDQMQTIGESLAEGRWARHVEGLEGWDKQLCAILLENELQWMAGPMNEVTKILQVGNFEKFAFPIIRAVYPNLIANEIVSVQPMSGPVSMVFYMDYLYGTQKGGIAAGGAAFDARTGSTGNETYTGDVVNGEVAVAADIGTGTWSPTASRTPIRPGTITVTTASAGGVSTLVDDGNGTFTITGADTISTATVNYATGAFVIDLSADVLAAGSSLTFRYDGEASDNVPQLDLQLTSAPVQALVRKLRARWSLEAAQNLNALHGLDAENELVGMMAETIKHEIDREIINDLRAFAGAGTVTWDKSVPPGISYTEHKISIEDAFVAANNRVFDATKRGQTNWIVGGIAVMDVVETLPRFKPAPGSQGTQANTGVIKTGTLNDRWTIFKDPFMPATEWIQGYKGSQFLDTGYIYAPYIPLYLTPTIILDDFIGRKGIGTQYGKKSINNLFYVKGNLLNP